MIKIIKTEKQHEQAMQRLFELAELDLTSNQEASDEFDLLSLLVEHYEANTSQPSKADPIDILHFYMEQHGLTHKDMQRYLGSKGTVSKILNRKLPLTLPKIWKLNEELGIPIELLAQRYPIQTQSSDIKQTALATFNAIVELITQPQKELKFTIEI